MNIYSAIRNLRDGQAVKPSNWRGYVKRVDIPTVPAGTAEYDSGRTTAYPAGTFVVNSGNAYINPETVPLSGGTVGEFDPARWLAVGVAYDPERASAYPVGSRVVYNNRLFANEAEVPAAVGSKVGPFDSSKWTSLQFDHDIVFMDAADGDGTGNPSATYRGVSTVAGVKYRRRPAAAGVTEKDMPDDELFAAILSDAWESGSAADYETQRVGGSGRW